MVTSGVPLFPFRVRFSRRRPCHSVVRVIGAVECGAAGLLRTGRGGTWPPRALQWSSCRWSCRMKCLCVPLISAPPYATEAAQSWLPTTSLYIAMRVSRLWRDLAQLHLPRAALAQISPPMTSVQAGTPSRALLSLQSPQRCAVRALMQHGRSSLQSSL